jgi:hypothetical protein
MLSDAFDLQTRTNMEIALQRVLDRFPLLSDQSGARRQIARAITMRTLNGDKSLHGMTLAGVRAAAEWESKLKL